MIYESINIHRLTNLFFETFFGVRNLKVILTCCQQRTPNSIKDLSSHAIDVYRSHLPAFQVVQRVNVEKWVFTVHVGSKRTFYMFQLTRIVETRLEIVLTI